MNLSHHSGVCSRPFPLQSLALIALIASAPLFANASTKDIVLDRIAAPVRTAAPTVLSSDAMVVSVLVERADGSLTPRSTQALFRTGERLRVKVLASRPGNISIYNTNPVGKTTLVWNGQVALGQETVSPRMILTGHSGEDKLHVLLEPTDTPQGMLSWLTGWLGAPNAGASKDVRLDVQSTPQSTYVLNPSGQGLVSTIRIAHTR
jgi:hypothetical protein